MIPNINWFYRFYLFYFILQILVKYTQLIALNQMNQMILNKLTAWLTYLFVIELLTKVILVHLAV